jgi:hypothetical protein
MDEMQDTLRAEAIASLKRKRKFWADALLYVSANGVLWLIWVLTDRTTDGSMPWPAWVSIVWGFFLAIDAVKAFVPWTGRVDEAAIEREMRRLQPH